MLTWLRHAVIPAFLFFALQLTLLVDDAKVPGVDATLATVDKLYRAGKFPEAEAGYSALLKTDPKLEPAVVGLVHAMLAQQKIDDALDTVNNALATAPNSAVLLAAKGDVQFRRGEMPDSEKSYLAAQTLPRAQLGLARLYLSYSMYRRAYDLLQIAHRTAPDDLEIQMWWLSMLPRKERSAALESLLASPRPGHEEEIKSMAKYLEALKARANEPVHPCRLISKMDHADMKLMAAKPDRMGYEHGVALSTKINGHNLPLELDTGAHGIIVSRYYAQSAGLRRLSAAYVGGIGDQGLQSAYRAAAEHIQIGDLEFEDCVVLVADTPGSGMRLAVQNGGLIGADVFGSYLVDLDLPEMRLKLSPLPKRPEDSVAATSLNSDTEEISNAEEDEESASTQTSRENPSKSSLKIPQPLPRDRFIAPEMSTWIQAFRFGHLLLIPTTVNDSKTTLFLIDSGMEGNSLSERAGRQASKLSEARVRIQGMSGEVNKVYTSDKVDLGFGRFDQKNIDTITFDFSNLNRQVGTEVSGALGYSTLKLLDVKLDYRDGLVDFEHNARRGKR